MMNITDVRKLATDNRQTYTSVCEIRKKRQDLEEALGVLKDEIINQLQDKEESTNLRRILSIRDGSKDKSLYECINQLPHYLYCLHAAEAIMKRTKYEVIDILPTANGNNRGFDIEARGKGRELLIAEVFCVSKKLFPGKKSKTVNKLLAYKDFDKTNVCVFVNAEARDTEITFKKDAQLLKRKQKINFYSIDAEGVINYLSGISIEKQCPNGLV